MPRAAVSSRSAPRASARSASSDTSSRGSPRSAASSASWASAARSAGVAAWPGTSRAPGEPLIASCRDASRSTARRSAVRRSSSARSARRYAARRRRLPRGDGPGQQHVTGLERRVRSLGGVRKPLGGLADAFDRLWMAGGRLRTSELQHERCAAAPRGRLLERTAEIPNRGSWSPARERVIGGAAQRVDHPSAAAAGRLHQMAGDTSRPAPPPRLGAGPPGGGPPRGWPGGDPPRRRGVRTGWTKVRRSERLSSPAWTSPSAASAASR